MSSGQINSRKPRILKRIYRSHYDLILWLLALALVGRVTLFVRQRSDLAFRSLDPSVLIDIYAASEMVIVGFCVLAILMSPLTKRAFVVIKSSSSKYLLSYYLVCIISFSWSYFAKYTVFRSVEMISLIILIFLCMVSYEDFFTAEKAFLIGSIILTLFGVLMHFRLGGAQISLSKLHTNQYSAMAAMAFVYCLGERFEAARVRKRNLTRLAVFFGCLTLLGTSATSNTAAFAGAAIILLLARKRKVEIFFFILAGSTALYWAGSLKGFWTDILLPGKTEHEILTLSGRTYLWTNYVRLIAERPLLGYGFAVVSRMGSFWGTVSTTNTHNGYIEVLLSTGILGGSFFLIWMTWLFKELVQACRMKRIGAVGMIGAIIVGLVNNMGRTMVGGAFDAPSAMFLVALAFFTVHVRVNRKALALSWKQTIAAQKSQEVASFRKTNPISYGAPRKL